MIAHLDDIEIFSIADLSYIEHDFVLSSKTCRRKNGMEQIIFDARDANYYALLALGVTLEITIETGSVKADGTLFGEKTLCSTVFRNTVADTVFQ